MITLPNIDSLIWSIEDKTAEIIYNMLIHDTIIIDLNGEGPCAESLGLYRLLDNLCAKFNFNKENIIIRTCNQLEKHPHYKIEKFPPLYVPQTQSFIKTHQFLFKNKTFDDDFKTFGLFIGRSNVFRLKLASVLHSLYQSQTLMTFHYDCNLDFHRDHLGFENLLKTPHSVEDIDKAIQLIKDSPIKVDFEQESYPILSPAHLNISKSYHSFFVEIVCETYFSGNSFYPTEKIWRPIVLKTPFIVQGPKNYYHNLRKLGFKTFHGYWDEGFGEDPYDYQPDYIKKIIKDLSHMTSNDLKSMYDDMTDILEHNYQVFMELRPQDFKPIFND